uniref:Predicted protein n=1 Tax=Hordeum vulgare subsp. vulgare TaxID=112509 RepID=F2DFG6_HORVV|nr:predicted protein [Hordeum vulgare subsp. vulgare]
MWILKNVQELIKMLLIQKLFANFKNYQKNVHHFEKRVQEIRNVHDFEKCPSIKKLINFNKCS